MVMAWCADNLAPIRRIRVIVLSWLAVALGLLIGFIALARFGMAWPPFGDNEPGWLLRWISYVGGAILGPLFIAATIVALRNPKRAGLILLVAMPFAVFSLAYPAAGYLVWHSDGSGWFEPPEVPTAVGLTVLFFLPIYTGLLALRRRRWTVYLFAFTVLLAGIAFGLSHWSRAFLPAFAGWSSLFLLFGIFWRGTSTRGWPSVIQPRSCTRGQRVVAIALTFIVVLCVDVAVTFGLAALGSSLFSGDCGGKPLVLHPASPYHAVFTARVVFVGRSIEALTRDRGLFRDPQVPGSSCGGLGHRCRSREILGIARVVASGTSHQLYLLERRDILRRWISRAGAVDPTTSDCRRGNKLQPH